MWSFRAPRQLLLRCSNKLHPYNDALSGHTTAMDGGSVENAGAGFRPLLPWR